ncbi:hypothetical protein L1887_51543 [Cichorium endivia]|nr:hypothetical protein L1887_51543 [Cichorium endivia]
MLSSSAAQQLSSSAAQQLSSSAAQHQQVLLPIVTSASIRACRARTSIISIVDCHATSQQASSVHSRYPRSAGLLFRSLTAHDRPSLQQAVTQHSPASAQLSAVKMADSIYAPHNQHKLDAARAANTTADSPASPASPAPPAATNASDADAAQTPSPQPDQHDHAEDRPHPHLTRPLLYISGVDPAMTDKELAGLVFEKVLPVRLKVDRNVAQGQTASGTVEFQTLDKAEKAYAIVRPPFQLSIDAAGADADPVASAKPRLIKQLPANTDDALVYDLFRRFGPLRRAHCLLTNPAGVHTGFKGMAVLDFYSEQDAQLAQTEMHCADVGGKTISVALDTAVRKVSSSLGEIRASAQPFVPGNGLSAAAPSFAPTVSGSRSVSAGSSASIYATPAAAATHDNHAGAAPKGARSLQYFEPGIHVRRPVQSVHQEPRRRHQLQRPV